MNLLIMADQKVGLEVTRWLLEKYLEDVAMVVVISENKIWEEVRDMNVPCFVFESSDQIYELASQLEIEFDVGVLVWWPTIIKRPLIDLPRTGFVNTHPSLLPHNRGKHYNFWALVEQAPFGVSLHMVEAEIDSGDVIAQKHIDYGWEDNGETLYCKAQKAMIALFQNTYPLIREHTFPRKPQNLANGSYHSAAELESASEIQLGNSYVASDLLNLLRARTFSGRPSCWFSDGEEKYEIRIEIKKKKP